jgi:hypothetical protein
MLYTVKYKFISSIFWKTLKSVKADGILIDTIGGQKSVLPYRWFILSDESRIEIPMDGVIFKFSKDRFYSIKKSMEAEVGQNIPIS